jgi:hypothetical protein
LIVTAKIVEFRLGLEEEEDLIEAVAVKSRGKELDPLGDDHV